MIYIDVKNVSKNFNKNKVISNVSIQVDQGRTIGIVGNNGSGKTVLLKMICGLFLPTEGKVAVKGKVIGKDIVFPDSMGLIIETPGFNASYSGYRNLKLLADITKRATKEDIREVMKLVGLNPDNKKHVAKYSLGMRQRLALAQAIMENPELLILDEPFNGLDKEGINEMRHVLLDMKAEGKTIIMTSHNAEDIDILCDEVYEMESGKIMNVNEQNMVNEEESSRNIVRENMTRETVVPTVVQDKIDQAFRKIKDSTKTK